jgi:hypothetical protein
MKQAPAPQPIDDFAGWLDAFTQTTVLLELAALGVMVAVAWGLVAALRRALASDNGSIWFGRKVVDGVLFPLALLCLGYATLELLSRFMNIAVFRLVIPVLTSLVVIRVGV